MEPTASSAFAQTGLPRSGAVARRRGAPQPVSAAQKRLWILEQLAPGLRGHVVLGEFRSRGRADFQLLVRALHEIVERHQILRSTFQLTGGGLVQTPSPDAGEFISIADIRLLSAESKQAWLHKRVEQEERRIFDLSRGPLFRVTLARLAEQECVAMIAAHRIVFDEPSLGIVCREWIEWCDLLQRSSPSSLPDLPIQFPDFVRWQEAHLSGGEAAEHAGFWGKHLRGLAEPLVLPRQGTGRRGWSTPVESAVFDFPRELADRLRVLGHHRQAAFWMVVMAGFQAYLHRSSGRTRTVASVPISGRHLADAERLAGPFASALPIPCDFSSDPTFLELIDQVRDSAAAGHARQETPFERIAETVSARGETGTPALTQFMVEVRESAQAEVETAGTLFRFSEIPTPSPLFDLSLRLLENGDELRGILDFRPDLYDRDTARRIPLDWIDWMERAASDPQRRMSAWQMPGADFLRVDSASGRREEPEPLASLFERRALQAPGAVAVDSRSESLTYAELNLKASLLAAHLRSSGVETGSAVGLSAATGIELAVALLGILKSGAACVPLDTGVPRERLEYIVRDAGLAAVVTLHPMRLRLPDLLPPLVCLDTDWEKIAQAVGPAPSPPEAGATALIVYASDRSGWPKGVPLTHAAAAEHGRMLAQALLLTSKDRVMTSGAAAAGVILDEIIPALLSGSTLLAGAPVAFERLQESQATVAHLMPGEWAALAQELGRRPPDLRLRQLVLRERSSGRESAALLRVLGERGAQVTAIEGFAETAGACFTADLTAEPPGPGETLLGRPLPGLSCLVLDERGRPAPNGSPGILHLEGGFIATRYLGRPELSEQSFRANPSTRGSGAILFRTGITAIRQADGRIRRAAPAGGLAETENALRQHPMIADCRIVHGREETGDGPLTAYIVTRDLPLFHTHDFDEFLRRRYPEHPGPLQFVMVDSLPEPEAEPAAAPAPESPTAAPLIEPRDATEKIIAELWQETLDLKRVGVSDHFFEIGGTSIQAARFIERFSAKLKRKIPLRLVFEAPVLEDLARRIGEEDHLSSNCITPLQTGGLKPPLFLIHDLGGGLGGMPRYRKLCRFLSREQRCYGIHAPHRPLGTVEEMAAHYFHAIREIQPEGPYALAGYGFGGCVAFEIARLVYEQGDGVRLLALLESRPPRVEPPAAASAAPPAHGAAARFWQWFTRTAPDPAAAAARRRPGDEFRIEAMMAAAESPGESWRHVEAHRRAHRLFLPRTYPGRLVLIRARPEESAEPEPALGWEAYAEGGVEVLQLSSEADHLFRDDSLPELGQKIQSCLDRVGVA